KYLFLHDQRSQQHMRRTFYFASFFFSSRRRHTRSVSAFLLNRSSDLRLATKSNQIKQLIRNGRSASLQRTFKKSFTSFSHSTRNKTRDGLIRVRNIRALNGRFNTSI